MTKLSGVVAAIPTPLNKEEKVNKKGLCDIIDYAVSEGADGIMILGSMGEGTALLDDQKTAAVETATSHLNKRKPLIVAVSDTSTQRVIKNAEALDKFDFDFLTSTAPFYYKHPHPESLSGFIKDVSGNVGKPYIFYNAPAATGNTLDLNTLEDALNLDNVVGLKDSSGNFHTVMELLRRYPNKETRPFFLMQGDEALIDVSLLMGADGLVTGGGTCFIRKLKELYNTCLTGNTAQAYKLQQQFIKDMMDMIGDNLLVDWMYRIKHRLAEKGLCEPNVTAPFLKRENN